jgi:TolB-like protein
MKQGKRGYIAFLLCVQASAGVCASDGHSGLEWTRVPMSVRQETYGGSYDVFKVFQNPALLGIQPRTFSAGLSNQLLYGGSENLWSVAGGYMAESGDLGSYGIAVLASGLLSRNIGEVDMFGSETGVEIGETALRGNMAGVYQWKFFNLGVSVGQASESYSGVRTAGGSSLPATKTFMVDTGTILSIGALDLGCAYHFRNGAAAGELSVGGALKLKGYFNGTLNGETYVPWFYQLSKPFTNVGITWNAHRMLEVRAGAFVPGSDSYSGRLGFTVRYKDYCLNYTLVLPLKGGLGSSHLIGLDYSFGKEQAQSKDTKSLYETRERTLAVGAFEPQNVSVGDAMVISDMFRNEIIKEGSFNVIEKSNMDRILEKQAFQPSGCTTSECAVRLGKILNVRYIVIGSFGKLLDLYVTNIRVVDVETAKAVYSDALEVKTSSDVPAAVRTLAAHLTEAVKKSK